MSDFISWKTQPIFISSTFTDMMSERDVLRDFVFHELAERLRARHIHLEPINLRWGVKTTDTKEQEEKELLVLKVCLDEIDRCKPFLIGLIGDRYGWVPPEERMKAAEKEKGFKSGIRDKSITALEIEYGVFADKEHLNRSRFYFRTPLDYDKMPEDKRADFSDMHNPDLNKDFAEKRLTTYKESIIAKIGKEKVYYYSDLEDFRKKVTQQIWLELDAQTKEQEDLRPKTWQNGLVRSFNNLGDIYLILNDPKNATIYYNKFLSLSIELQSLNQDSAEYSSGLAIAYRKLGSLHKTLGDIKKALIYYESALNVAKELHKRNPDSAIYARGLEVLHNSLGDINKADGDEQSARMNYDSSLKIAVELRNLKPDSTEYAKDLVVCYLKLNRIQNLKEALNYMISKSMDMDQPLIKLRKRLGM